MSKLRVLEAFSGVGSQRMALRNLGIDHEVVAIAEIDKYAIKSYEAIHGQPFNLGDISKINTEDIPDHDLFTYSFPCQDISLCGNQGGLDEGSETRSSLLWECKKVIEVKKPKYLLLENVKNLVGKKHKPNFDKWLEWLETQGYTNYWKVLNAKEHGTPQNRERVFVVSILGEHTNYEFPQPIELKLKLKDVLEKEVEEKYYLKTVKDWFIQNSFNMEAKGNGFRFSPHIKENANISKCITTREGNQMDDNFIIEIDCPEEKFEFSTKNEYIKVKEATKKGYAEAHIGDSINLEHPNSTTRRGRVGKQVAQTLTTSPQQVAVLNNYKIRKLTPKECWRLMGFSDEDFEKVQAIGMSNAQLYKQAGNSIVVNVLEGIFRNLFL